MAKRINVGVVDDQQLFRKGIISLLKDFNNINIVIEAENGLDFFHKLEPGNNPDIILLDVEMPKMNGIEVLKKLKEKNSKIKPIIITMYDEEELVLHLVENGACGFLPKNEDIENVVNAINSVFISGYYFNDKFSKALLQKMMSNEIIQPRFYTAALTEREIEILQLICKEYTNKEIANSMNISSRTVDGHRENLLKKTGAKNTAGLVLFAIKSKLI